MNGWHGPHHQINLSGSVIGLLVVLIIWETVWKGIALWKASRNHQLRWFIAMLILNTVGILEIVYILFFQAKPKNEKPLS